MPNVLVETDSDSKTARNAYHLHCASQQAGSICTQNKQVLDLGSLNSTPLLKSSSTPKAAVTCLPDKINLMKEEDMLDAMQLSATRCLTKTESNLSNPSSELKEPSEKAACIVSGEGSLHQNEEETDETESTLKKRWIFIEDVKQKCAYLKHKFLIDGVEFSQGTAYNSPVLEFHSPNRNNSTEKLNCLPGAMKEYESLPCPWEKRLNSVSFLRPKPRNESLEVETSTQFQKVTPDVEEDSFWGITTLDGEKNETMLNLSDMAEAKSGNIFNILHADYPGKGYRVIKKASGPDLSTIYYHWSDRKECKSFSSPSDKLVFLQPQVSKLDTVVCDSQATTDNQQQTLTSDHGVFPCEHPEAEGDQAEREKNKANPDSDNKFCIKGQSHDRDCHNQTFTIDGVKIGAGYANRGICVTEYVPTGQLQIESSFSIKAEMTELGSAFKEQLKISPEGDYDNHNHNNGDDNCNEGDGDYDDEGDDKMDMMMMVAMPKMAMVMMINTLIMKMNVISNDDFEFEEFYIDDDLDKTEQIQPLSTGSDIPSLMKEKASNGTDQSTKQFTSNDQPNSQCRMEQHDSTRPYSSRYSASCEHLQHRTPVIPQNLAHQSSENICQSAMCKSSELEDVRHKVLSRQSASDKAISPSRNASVHLIARSHCNSRNREGVPAKSGAKQSSVSDRLRSGISDPSLSISVMREKGVGTSQTGDDTSQQEATLADDINIEDENTLAIASPNLDDSIAALEILPARNETLGQRRESENGKAFVSMKNEASQTSADTYATIPNQNTCDSDSVESDLWVKQKLSVIQGKIQRRKSRPGYVISSDEEDTSCFRDLSPISHTAIKTASSCFPNTSCPNKVLKPKKSRSFLDLGIQVNENYSKVMEELKNKYKSRRIQTDASSSNERRKSDSLWEIKPKICKSGISQQSNLPTSSKRYVDNISSNISLKRKQHKVMNFNSVCVHSEFDSRKNGPSERKPSPFRETMHQTKDFKKKSFPDYCHLKESYPEESKQFNMPEQSPNKESRKPPILRKQSKESISSFTSLATPHSKTKLPIEEKISLDEFTEVSEEERSDQHLDTGYLQPSASKRTKYSSQETPSMKITENWLNNQNFKHRFSPVSQDHLQAAQDQEKWSLTSGKRSVAWSEHSKHSIVSFSNCEAQENVGSSSIISTKSGSKKVSLHHRHEARKDMFSNSEWSHHRGERTSKKGRHESFDKKKPLKNETDDLKSAYKDENTHLKEIVTESDEHLVTVDLENSGTKCGRK
ncbi:hypothetical protein PoB_000474500 [Plakobranchus ocellatus]|uniref:Uncharacterized protein n=1 Tax=Plakobranchus ocellatus TaxID=259542 RepID=A0AAV3Y629_9GAST|nr:hypothetical protein PoB_000474500 [Plakobranchus ocellatus]